MLTTLRETRRTERGERGSTLFVALLILSGLLAIAAIIVAKVSRGQRSTTQAHLRTVAHFAAESGISAGIDFLRPNVSPTLFFSTFVSPNNSAIQTPLGIAGNTIAAGNAGNLFGGSLGMSYTVSIKNNSDDPGFASGSDSDGIVILHALGVADGNSRVAIEVSVQKKAGVSALKVLNWKTLE